MTLHLQPITINVLKVLTLCGLVAVCCVVAQSSLVAEHSLVATAVTIDLLVTLPLGFLFSIRKTSIPKTAVIPLFLGAIALAWVILPGGDRYLFDLTLRFGLPVIEILGLFYAGSIVVKARKKLLAEAVTGRDLAERLRRVLIAELSPPIGKAIAFEFATIYFAFLRWRRDRPAGFTYHKNSGFIVTISVLIMLVMIETTVMHLVIASWFPVAAWVLTGLSAYFVLQLFAHCKAVLLRPIEIRGGNLLVRCGLLADCEIAIATIDTIVAYEPQRAAEKGTVTLSPLGKLAHPTVAISLRYASDLNGVYGLKRSFSTLGLCVDESARFIAEIRSIMDGQGHERETDGTPG